jgi:hypothetical protein
MVLEVMASFLFPFKNHISQPMFSYSFRLPFVSLHALFTVLQLPLSLQLKEGKWHSLLQTKFSWLHPPSKIRLVNISPLIYLFKLVNNWERGEDFSFSCAISALSWKAFGEQFLFVGTQEEIVLIDVHSGGAVTWRIPTAFPPHHLCAADTGDHLAFCAKIDKNVRIVDERNHLQYLAHKCAVLSVLWNKAITSADRGRPSSLITLTANGVSCF